MPKELVKIEARYQWDSDAWEVTASAHGDAEPARFSIQRGTENLWQAVLRAMTAGEDPVDGQKLTISEELDLEE